MTQKFSQSHFRIQTRSQRHRKGPRPRRLTKALQSSCQCAMGAYQPHRAPDGAQSWRLVVYINVRSVLGWQITICQCEYGKSGILECSTGSMTQWDSIILTFFSSDILPCHYSGVTYYLDWRRSTRSWPSPEVLFRNEFVDVHPLSTSMFQSSNLRYIILYNIIYKYYTYIICILYSLPTYVTKQSAHRICVTICEKLN